MTSLLPVDLRTCKVGDKLRSKHGMILTYAGLANSSFAKNRFPHLVTYPNGSYGSRTDDGFVYSNPEKRMECDHDIVEIIPQNT